VSHARLRREGGLQWPCPAVVAGDPHPGTRRLYADHRFPTPDGRARFHAVRCAPPAEEPDDEYPVYLTTGRLLAHYQSGTQTRRVPSLGAAEPEPFVEIHPQLAQSHGVGDGDPIALRTRRGRATFRARLSPAMRLDTVFVPFHFGGAGRVNTLTQAALDPTSKMPELKIAAARIEAGDEENEEERD
jgi:assimilatory nitrate reductase catalytic subunit